jgi:hypothetical protein
MFFVSGKEKGFHFIRIDNSAEDGGWIFGVVRRIKRDFNHADTSLGGRFTTWDPSPHITGGFSGFDLFGNFFRVNVWVCELAGGDSIILETFSKVTGLDGD